MYYDTKYYYLNLRNQKFIKETDIKDPLFMKIFLNMKDYLYFKN
jgi:hypothetical protein